jgi:hypothetical protein
MEKLGNIEISIEGRRGNINLSPDNYDIKEIKTILENIENLLFPSEKKDRPVISYQITEGSVKHIFKTSMQYIIGFNAIIGQVNQLNNIDFLYAPTASAFEDIQEHAIKNDFVFTISTSVENSNTLKIDKTTKYFRTEALWLDAEFYFYGKITNMGGKDKANIHLVTDELGTLIIQTPKEEIEKIENNPLYKTFGVRAVGKQHSETGEIDVHSLKYLELIAYQPKYDIDYLKNLRIKATNSWLKNIKSDEWLSEIRGSYGT